MRSFQQLISERKFRCQEFEMLHRTTTLLSAVVVVFLAAPVLNAVSPTTARAADNCLVRPTGSAPNGSHWYYQNNRVTRQKCWVLGARTIAGVGTATGRTVALQGLFDPASSNRFAEPAIAVSCIEAPNRRAPRGKRWYRHADDATGQGCWQLGAAPAQTRLSKARVVRSHVSGFHVSRSQVLRSEVLGFQVLGFQVSKTGNIIPARSLEPAGLIAPEMTAVALAQATADARAEFLDEFSAPVARIAAVALPAPITTEPANNNPATPTFASRWSNLLDPAPSSGRLQSAFGISEYDRPVPVVFDDVTNSSKTGDRLFTAEHSVYVTLLVFLASLGGVLVVFGLIGVAFLYLRARYVRSTPAVPPNPLPRGNVFGNDSPKAPVRPAGIARDIAEVGDPSSPDSPDAVKPAGRRNDADGPAGGDQRRSDPPAGLGDRRVRQFDIEYA